MGGAQPSIQRFQLLDGLGDQLLPVLVSLPDVEVAPGTRPTFTDAQVRRRVEEQLGDVRGIKRKVLLEARVALVRLALEACRPAPGPRRAGRARPPLTRSRGSP